MTIREYVEDRALLSFDACKYGPRGSTEQRWDADRRPGGYAWRRGRQ
jgi:hypothetical protein